MPRQQRPQPSSKGAERTTSRSECAGSSDSSHTPSEDELRTKIVYPFLLEHGFSPSDVKIEFAFSIRIGRCIEKRPRTDALVTKNGRAIFAIECKREDHELTPSDQQQAISYARLVQPQMPPYTILTNGDRTVVLDTYLGRPCLAAEISAENGAVASPVAIEEAMRMRYLANKHLLCLSAHSLRMFLVEEIGWHIRAHSGTALRPPYIRDIHIARPEIWRQIEDFCQTDALPILPIIGPATIGKTSEIFTCIQERMLCPESKIVPLYIPINLSGPDFLKYLAETSGGHLCDRRIQHRFSMMLMRSRAHTKWPAWSTFSMAPICPQRD